MLDIAVPLLGKNREEDLRDLNSSLLEIGEGMDFIFSDIIGHIVKNPGKLMRGQLLLTCARIFKGKREEALHFACVIELIHMASLLHDDVIDEGFLRRMKPTVRVLWGNKKSILVGDYLSAYGLAKASEYGSLNIVSLLAHAITSLVKGEMLQMTRGGSLSLDETLMWEIMANKTSPLFASALEIGGMVGHVCEEKQFLLRKLGEKIGYLFQLVDDFLDYYPSLEGIVKSKGQDFYEGKVTLPVIWAYKNGSSAEKSFWESVFLAPKRTRKDFKQAQRFITTTHATEALRINLQRILKELDRTMGEIFSSKEKADFSPLVGLIWRPLEKIHGWGV